MHTVINWVQGEQKRMEDKEPLTVIGKI